MKRAEARGFMPVRRRSTGEGFTLIELLVVISIIVVLLSILVPGIQKAFKAAERGKCGVNQQP